MEETITRKRRSKWDVTSEPQNPIEHDGDPPIKSNNSVGCDVFISEMKISDRSPTTIHNGIYGFDAIMESKVTLSLPSKMEADPNVLSTKIEADKFVEYSQMKDEDPPIKSNNSAEGDVFISKIKSPDHYPTTINNGSYGPNNDTAMILSFPSKTETDPDVVSTTKTDADKFVEYSKMKDEDFDLLPGKRVKTEISAKKHHSNKTMSPGHESWRQRSPAMSLSHSGKSRRSRSRSRSWSRSRSRGRSRTRSCSRSPSYGHGRRSLRSRSRSRSPYYRSRREPDDSMDMRRPRIPCRDFAVGRCHRGIDCRYIHDDTSRRPYNPFHDVDERKVEKENVNVSKEPIDNTHRDTRGYPRYSKEQVENTRRNERESLQNSREPIDNTNKNERESFRDSREPIDNRHRYERENFHDSREPIDDINRNERENFRDSREPIDTRRNKRENYRDSREPIVSTQRNERENYRDSREPIDPRHRNEGENIRDSREQIENRWRDERDDLGDSREPMEYTRRNERDNVRDSRDRFTRNDSRPPVACYDFSRGRCQRGSDCRYAHHDSSSFDNGRSYSSSRDEYRTRTQRVLRDTVCKFFADGCCRRGQSCSFSHVILGPRDGGNGQNQQQHQNQTQIQNQNQNLNLNQPQNAINPLPFPLQPSNIQMPQLVPPMPVDEQMPQAMLSMIQNGQNQFVPQPNSNFNIPVQNLPFVPPQNFNLLPSNTVGQQVQQALPFAAPNFVGPTLQNIPFNDNPIPPQLPNPENQIIASEIQSSNISNDIAQKVVTSEQAAKITNISASLAMFFENQGALNPQTATESVTETDTKKNTEVEVREAVKETGTVDKKKEGEGEESKQTKDGKGMKMFKCAIVDFVKDALKPNWKEGQLSREAHKTIVKKVVEKVTGAMQSQNIPHTQEKIDIYMSHSKPKLSKLVQAYVEKYVKG